MANIVGMIRQLRFPRSLLPHTVNDVVAFLPLLHELRDQLRRVLQVGVDDHDGVAARRQHARRNGVLIPEIAAEADELPTRVAQDMSRMISGVLSVEQLSVTTTS